MSGCFLRWILHHWWGAYSNRISASLVALVLFRDICNWRVSMYAASDLRCLYGTCGGCVDIASFCLQIGFKETRSIFLELYLQSINLIFFYVCIVLRGVVAGVVCWSSVCMEYMRLCGWLAFVTIAYCYRWFLAQWLDRWRFSFTLCSRRCYSSLACIYISVGGLASALCSGSKAVHRKIAIMYWELTFMGISLYGMGTWLWSGTHIFWYRFMA